MSFAKCCRLHCLLFRVVSLDILVLSTGLVSDVFSTYFVFVYWFVYIINIGDLAVLLKLAVIMQKSV